jgi:hypothetical protein
MFQDMGDWCMAKDYNGAERFNDGSRPLIAETPFADIVISGTPNESEVSIGVYPNGGMLFYEGKAANKELAQKIGMDIANHLDANEDGPFVFFNGDFTSFFKSLQITGIRTAEETNTSLSDSEHNEIVHDCEDDLDQGEEI